MRRNYVGLAASAFVAAISSANADVITQTRTFSNDTGSVSPGSGSLPKSIYSTSGTLNFAGFNSALGTLNSVSIGFGASSTVSVGLIGPAEAGGTFEIALSTDLPAGSLPTMDDLIILLAEGSPPFDSTTVNLSTPTTLNVLTGSSAAVFISSGLLDFSVGLNITGFSTGGGGSLGFLFQEPGTRFDAMTNAQFTVDYDYTPAVASVPEPASGALTILGFAGLGLVTRRHVK